MSTTEEHQRRPFFSPGGGDALVFFVVFGDIKLDTPPPVGIPAGISLVPCDGVQRAETVGRFRSGIVWDDFRDNDPVTAREVATSPGCVVVVGTVDDPPTLGYLFDCVGLISWMLDHGGVAVLDSQCLRWRSADEWRERVSGPASPSLFEHAVLLLSPEEGTDRVWIHTRGMRKFGRPDVSVRHVPPVHRADVLDLCNRFIEFQALGGMIREGQEVRAGDLPLGGVCRHAGHPDNPEFNNVHVEIAWPAGGPPPPTPPA